MRFYFHTYSHTILYQSRKSCHQNRRARSLSGLGKFTSLCLMLRNILLSTSLLFGIQPVCLHTAGEDEIPCTDLEISGAAASISVCFSKSSPLQLAHTVRHIMLTSPSTSHRSNKIVRYHQSWDPFSLRCHWPAYSRYAAECKFSNQETPCSAPCTVPRPRMVSRLLPHSLYSLSSRRL